MMRKILAIISILFLLLVSCKANKQIITEKETKTEVVEKPLIHEVYKVNTVRDTVWNKDSVYIIQKGDTVYNKTIREFHHYKNSTDTIHKNDTITQIVIQPEEKIVEVEKEVEVEKKISNWQKFRMNMGDIAIAVLVGLVIVYFVRKKKIL